MTVSIHDASILLDLIHSELLQPFLAIPSDMVATDFVVGEITDGPDKEKLATATTSGALEVLASGLAEIESIAAIQTTHRALSTADCSVLFHASRLQAVVLTGDSRLRREAREAGLDVHGTVWAFDELVGQGLLSEKRAASKLERLPTCGRCIWRRGASYASHGSISSKPVFSKSLVFRVARSAPRTRQIAAICASGIEIGAPIRSRWSTMSAYSTAAR
jgi:predicted nucleic acid-binding protein